MGLASSLRDLKALSIEELESLHDQQAKSTMVGTQYYLDELGRREQDALNQEMLRLTREMHQMTVVMTRATKVALVISVISLIASFLAILM